MDAMSFLEQAINRDAYRFSILRRNVLITMAELCTDDPLRAAKLTAEAVKLCTETKMFEPLIVETLAEHGIALSNAGKKVESLEAFEEATSRVFAIRSDKGSWKGLMARVFGVIAYFSSLAYHGRPENGQVEPKQGLFLSSNEEASNAYRTEQLAYVCIRLAMFADGVKDIRKAAEWTWKAIEFAKEREDPATLNVVRSCAWRALPAALVSNDFVRAAQLIDFSASADDSALIEAARATHQAGVTGEQIARIQASRESTQTALKSVKSALSIVPIVLRLASLQLQGRSADAVSESLIAIETVIPRDSQIENFVEETKRALLDGADWRTLWKEGGDAIQRQELVRGFVLCIGAVCNATSISQSLYLQISLAQNLEKFATHATVYREIVAPFFVALWERAINEYVGVFRTAHRYTEQQLKLADGSPEGTRNLLRAMRLCLGTNLPRDQMKWLEGPG
jgi:tetratricopeptide (TPR) repeat protein